MEIKQCERVGMMDYIVPLKRLLILMVLLNFSLIGCKSVAANAKAENRGDSNIGAAHETLDAITLREEINSFMGQFIGSYSLDTGLEVERRLLMGESTEGGEIIQYKNADGTILRYKLIYYGEMGRAEENYYFINDFSYYTKLTEYYSCHIFIDKDADILYRNFEEVIIAEETYYRYDSTTMQLKTIIEEGNSYYTQDELNILFDGL